RVRPGHDGAWPSSYGRMEGPAPSGPAWPRRSVALQLRADGGTRSVGSGLATTERGPPVTGGWSDPLRRVRPGHDGAWPSGYGWMERPAPSGPAWPRRS